jgi:hypothetical protein
MMAKRFAFTCALSHRGTNALLPFHHANKPPFPPYCSYGNTLASFARHHAAKPAAARDLKPISTFWRALSTVSIDPSPKIAATIPRALRGKARSTICTNLQKTLQFTCLVISGHADTGRYGRHNRQAQQERAACGAYPGAPGRAVRPLP